MYKRGWVVLESCLCGCGKYPCIYIYTRRGDLWGVWGHFATKKVIDWNDSNLFYNLITNDN